MAPEIDVANETSAPIRAEGVSALVTAVLAAEGVEGAVDVAFVGDADMAELNQRFRGVPGPTDVLSFPGGVDDGQWPEPPGADGAAFLGDLLICPAVARMHAEEDGIALEEELARLLVHGALHLLGYDHEVDDGEMKLREDDLLAELLGLAGGLVSVP